MNTRLLTGVLRGQFGLSEGFVSSDDNDIESVCRVCNYRVKAIFLPSSTINLSDHPSAQSAGTCLCSASSATSRRVRPPPSTRVGADVGICRALL